MLGTYVSDRGPLCSVQLGIIVYHVYMKMELCISPLPSVEEIEQTAGGNILTWPKRLNAAPPRIISKSIVGVTIGTFNHENKLWNKRILHYEAYLSDLPRGKYRNIMDMNAGFGGFAAALSKYPVWVMNVIPVDGKNNTLGIVYERGLIGTYTDWFAISYHTGISISCRYGTYRAVTSIPTYGTLRYRAVPVLYWIAFRCEIIDILLEMDRILRPEGAVIIRDHVDVIVKAKQAADRLRWQSKIVHSENGPFHPEKLLIVDNSVAVDGNQASRHRY
ncbi:hypothetical protein BHM03_00042754 [Ensete ventricosum]|nr:hypothetical protein BHM03_00042754 [Ensete ventricosum]